eukprot:5461442-Pyramimonas_sp.AAC.1
MWGHSNNRTQHRIDELIGINNKSRLPCPTLRKAPLVPASSRRCPCVPAGTIQYRLRAAAQRVATALQALQQRP